MWCFSNKQYLYCILALFIIVLCVHSLMYRQTTKVPSRPRHTKPASESGESQILGDNGFNHGYQSDRLKKFSITCFSDWFRLAERPIRVISPTNWLCRWLFLLSRLKSSQEKPTSANVTPHSTKTRYSLMAPNSGRWPSIILVCQGTEEEEESLFLSVQSYIVQYSKTDSLWH